MINADINRGRKEGALFKAGVVIRAALKFCLGMFIVLAVAGIVAGTFIIFYISGLSGEKIAYDMRATKLNLTSIIYINDGSGNTKEYDQVYNTENRVWAEFKDIPSAMKDSVVAIEDKRFLEHMGVDWVRTFGAIGSLFRTSDGGSYGGSTLTQQLIKNLTDDNEISINRKIKEIFRALNFEREYSKDEILEAYLNVVNFGGGCRGVQAAAHKYFSCDIKQCSVAQCATIAGITQNPSAYNPLIHPENNKIRREIVLDEMLKQGKISKEQHKIAMIESQNMVFKKSSGDDDGASNIPVRNWYTEAMLSDITNDLCSNLGIGRAAAEEMLFTQGLKIYSAMDEKAQRIAQDVISDKQIMPHDKRLELGYMMMNFEGRILATLGSRSKKEGNLLFDRANNACRQPGSAIKPIAAYAPAIDVGLYNYSSIVPDEPIEDFYGPGKPGPNNWYSGYKGGVTLQWAIERSANATVAQVLRRLTHRKSYDFLKRKLGFVNLVETDLYSLSALSMGGLHKGVTVREITAAYQIFGNGGTYYKPHTYFYVMDKNGKILLDNRDKIGVPAINSKTATIMNRLLRQVIVGDHGTGGRANIDGHDVIGKTGTTNDDKDSWFIGETPYAVAGIWVGYDSPKRVYEPSVAAKIWREIMVRYLDGRSLRSYDLDSEVVTASYCRASGKLDKGGCGSLATGYYSPDNMPEVCEESLGLEAKPGTEQDMFYEPSAADG